ncbi:ABC transporter substrate-binding protein [Vreelandella alkaliphila]|uniref:ABC transporter substrate-binding protein n=1 Tax=Vreelandella alkaliphila TaxID=272774 RepID=UPI0039F4A047
MKAKNKMLLPVCGFGLLMAGQFAMAEESDPVKLGLMLPYTGTYTALGEAITNGLKLAIEQNNGQLGGREVEYVQLDSEANPSKAPQNMSRLVNSDEVDFVIGPVHSGVAMGMLRVPSRPVLLRLFPMPGWERQLMSFACPTSSVLLIICGRTATLWEKLPMSAATAR